MTSIVNFTPVASTAGGILIGVAAAGLMAIVGRIMGLTGIISGVVPEEADDPPGWRIAFLAGAILAPVLLLAAGYGPIPFTPQGALVWLPATGALVGIGVALGNGCPSGHGVCGLARLSPRSAVAVATFMATAAVTVLVTRHLVGG